MAQHKFNFRLITRDDSTAALARHGAVRKRTELKTRMAGEDRSWPAGRRDLLPESRSASSRRGAGRERSAAVVEHRRILGKACRDGRLGARPARQSRGGACRAGDADAVSLRGICSRTMRNVVGP